MSAFSERPFVAGSLTGLRAFYVDRYGRLISPTWGERVFTPGENVATCERNQGVVLSGGGFRITAPMWVTGFETPEEEAKRKEREQLREQPHDTGALFCECGFYAYTDGRNDFLKQSRMERVGAIVEGYGTCTVGTRGFRASSARLVALIEPHKTFADPVRWARVLHNYSETPVYATKKDALAAHPLHETPLPTPETAEDFWALAVAR